MFSEQCLALLQKHQLDTEDMSSPPGEGPQEHTCTWTRGVYYWLQQERPHRGEPGCLSIRGCLKGSVIEFGLLLGDLGEDLRKQGLLQPGFCWKAGAVL